MARIPHCSVCDAPLEIDERTKCQDCRGLQAWLDQHRPPRGKDAPVPPEAKILALAARAEMELPLFEDVA